MLRFAAFTLLVSGLAAQGYTSPAFFANAEGPNNNVFPFGNTTVPFRFSQIHDDVPAGLITGMRFRHNLAIVQYPAHSVTIDAWVSTAVSPSTGANATFDNNHGPDKIQVIFNRTYNHPASVAGQSPGALLLDYPFDVPFVFGGAPNSLCWEVHVTAKTQTTSVVYDAASQGSTNPTIQLGRGGTGCISTGRSTAMLCTATQAMNWTTGGTATINGSNLLANGPVFLATGFDRVAWPGGLLPQLIPTSDLGPSGSCFLYVNSVVTNFALASATGTVAQVINIPANPALHSLVLYSQILGLDASANAFGITASNFATHAVVAPHGVQPVSRIFLSGSLGATGTASGSSYLVTNFY
jgi:hypothetical protein